MYNSSYFYKIDNDKKLCMYVYFYIFISGLVEIENNIEGITLIVNLDFLYVCGRGWWCRCEMDADMDFLDSSVGKEYVWNMGDLGLIPGLRRSCGEGKSYPLQYLEDSHGLYSHKESDMTERLSASLSLSWKEKVNSGWENAPCLIWTPFFNFLYVFVWKTGHQGKFYIYIYWYVGIIDM